MMKSLDVTPTKEMNLEQFVEKIENHEEFDYLNEANIELFFNELKEKLKKDEEKTRIKAKRRFSEILYNCKITRNTTWDTLTLPTSADVAYLPLTEEERKSIFEEELKKRALDNDFQDSDEDEDFRARQAKEKERSKRRDSRSRSRSYSPRRDDHKRRRSDYEKEDSRKKSRTSNSSSSRRQ